MNLNIIFLNSRKNISTFIKLNIYRRKISKTIPYYNKLIVHARGDRATNSGAASEYRFVIFRGSPSANPTFVAPPFENLSVMNYCYVYFRRTNIFCE